MALLALIDVQANTIVNVFEDTGWVDLPGVGRVSPPVDGWTYEDLYSILAVVRATVPNDGSRITGKTYSLVGGVPTETLQTLPPPPPPPDVSNSDNLEDILKALLACVAEVGGLTQQQAKDLFKQKYDIIAGA